jgi:hypothetical protein
MTKTPLAWSSNTARVSGVAYSSATTTYSSANTSYSSSTATASFDGSLPISWTKQAKTAAAWLRNPDSDDNQYAYDNSGILFNSTRTYDGIVVGDDYLNDSLPTVWTAA